QGEQDVHGPLVSDQVDGPGGRAIVVGRRSAPGRFLRPGEWLFPRHWYPNGAYVSNGCLLDERYQTVTMQSRVLATTEGERGVRCVMATGSTVSQDRPAVDVA